MNSKIISIISFATGATIGSLATWYLLRDKYEKMAQEEIDSVKKVFSSVDKVFTTKNHSEDPTHGFDRDTFEARTKAEINSSKPDIMEYVSKVAEEGYTNYSNISNEPQKNEVISEMEGPYVIAPEDFGEFEDYEKVSLTYYSDGILTDERDEVIIDVDDTVGNESLTHFGEYEDDSVFVRNERLRCDYEILLDERTYSDVIEENPYLNTEE